MRPKFGRKRPVAQGPRMKLKRYLRFAMPDLPAECDYGRAASEALSDVMCNDALGCCVVSGAYHVVGVETGNAGTLYHASSDVIVTDYGKIGGYVPGDPSTDNGCDEPTALAYWQQNGFADGTKLLGWLALNAADEDELKAACFLFENLMFGIELPDAWVNPFPSSDGFVWDVGTPNPRNGHCVMGVGYDSRGVHIDSWGLMGLLTWEAISALCRSEAGGAVYALVTPDQLATGQTVAPNGVQWGDLINDFEALGGKASPRP